MSRASTFLATLVLFALAGTATAQDPAEPAAAPVDAAAPPALPTALPDLDPDAYFKGQTGGSFGKNIVKVLPQSRRVAVGGFRVVFVVDNTIVAQVRSSYLPGKEKTGAASKTQVALSGVDGAALQAIADRAHAAFLEQLRIAGREVVSQETLQGFYAGLDATPSSAAAPYRKEVKLGYGEQTALAFSPAGVPLWWSSWDAPWSDKSAFQQTNIRRLTAHAKELDAIMIAPVIVVDFAQMTTSGNRSGLLAREAQTGAALGISVAAISSPVLTKSHEGSMSLTQPVGSELAFATLEETARSSNRTAVGVLTALGLNPGSAKSRSANLAITDDALYSAAALDALERATGALAKLFEKYPPS